MISTLYSGAASLRLSVRDDGSGIAPGTVPGMGWSGMEERVRALGFEPHRVRVARQRVDHRPAQDDAAHGGIEAARQRNRGVARAHRRRVS